MQAWALHYRNGRNLNATIWIVNKLCMVHQDYGTKENAILNNGDNRARVVREWVKKVSHTVCKCWATIVENVHGPPFLGGENWNAKFDAGQTLLKSSPRRDGWWPWVRIRACKVWGRCEGKREWKGCFKIMCVCVFVCLFSCISHFFLLWTSTFEYHCTIS